MSRYAAGNPSDPVDQLAQKIGSTRKDLDEAVKPRASQIFKTLQEVQDLVENLSEQVDEILSTLTYDRATVDAKDSAVFNALTASLSSGLAGKANASHTHSVAEVNGSNWTGAVDTSASVRGDAALASLGAVNFNVASAGGPYRALWIQDSSGVIGYSASTILDKTNLRDANNPELRDYVDPHVFMQIHVQFYERLAEVRRRDDPSFEDYRGPEYHVGTELGVIAEELHELGLWPFVMYEDGVPIGVHHALFGFGLILATQMIYEEHLLLVDRVSALERLLRQP